MASHSRPASLRSLRSCSLAQALRLKPLPVTRQPLPAISSNVASSRPHPFPIPRASHATQKDREKCKNISHSPLFLFQKFRHFIPKISPLPDLVSVPQFPLPSDRRAHRALRGRGKRIPAFLRNRRGIGANPSRGS